MVAPKAPAFSASPLVSTLPVANFEPIFSPLPMEHPEFQEIVVAFLPRLRERIEEMDSAVDRNDFVALAELAHWLKGSGGTVGFPQFTELCKQLEEMATAKDDARNIKPVLAEIRALAMRIQVPESGSQSVPNKLSVPLNKDAGSIVTDNCTA